MDVRIFEICLNRVFLCTIKKIIINKSRKYNSGLGQVNTISLLKTPLDILHLIYYLKFSIKTP